MALSAGALASFALPPAFAGAATAPVRTGFAPVPDGKVWYRVYGSGPKTPILTLHDGPGAAHNYLLPLRALADDRPVIFYDQLGCGLSDSPRGEGPYHIARFVAEVDAVREALGLQRVILYGHSWGTMLAIEYFVTGHGRDRVCSRWSARVTRTGRSTRSSSTCSTRRTYFARSRRPTRWPRSRTSRSHRRTRS
ncbi:MAG TPA: alpha/beta fold hydrolase [Candidatus Limnocylindria bacterium]|nr:alpha/beta fold hydrolase [Candidatus Limnocylindria bacterium]